MSPILRQRPRGGAPLATRRGLPLRAAGDLVPDPTRTTRAACEAVPGNLWVSTVTGATPFGDPGLSGVCYTGAAPPPRPRTPGRRTPAPSGATHTGVPVRAGECATLGGTVSADGTSCDYPDGTSDPIAGGPVTAAQCGPLGGTVSADGTSCDYPDGTSDPIAGAAPRPAPGGSYYGGQAATDCEDNGGTWNYASGECTPGAADTPPDDAAACGGRGGTWDGAACVPPAGGTELDPAAVCAQKGGTWDGTGCVDAAGHPLALPPAGTPPAAGGGGGVLLLGALAAALWEAFS